jgi:hypothetical protein
MGTMARTAVIAGTATAVSGSVARKQHEKAAAAAGAQQAAAPPAAAPAPPPPSAGGLSTEAIEQLKQLAELRDQGVLTEDEFAAQKARLLG